MQVQIALPDEVARTLEMRWGNEEVEFDYDEADLESDRQTHEQLQQDRKLNIL